MGEIIHLNEPEIKQQLGEMIRKSVEETLNAMLDAEAVRCATICSFVRTKMGLVSRVLFMIWNCSSISTRML